MRPGGRGARRDVSKLDERRLQDTLQEGWGGARSSLWMSRINLDPCSLERTHFGKDCGHLVDRATGVT